MELHLRVWPEALNFVGKELHDEISVLSQITPFYITKLPTLKSQ